MTSHVAELVATAFAPFLPMLMAYATYCGHFTDAPAKLGDAISRSRKVAACVERGQV